MSNTNLTAAQKTTLETLFELQNATTEEVATALSISNSAARSRLRRLESHGLVECERSEGTASNASRALVTLSWIVDTDDDDVRTALGMALVVDEDEQPLPAPLTNEMQETPSDDWMLVTRIAGRADDYKQVTARDPRDGGSWRVLVLETFDVEEGDSVKLEMNDGELSVVDVQQAGESEEQDVQDLDEATAGLGAVRSMATETNTEETQTTNSTITVKVLERRKRKITLRLEDITDLRHLRMYPTVGGTVAPMCHECAESLSHLEEAPTDARCHGCGAVNLDASATRFRGLDLDEPEDDGFDPYAEDDASVDRFRALDLDD